MTALEITHPLPRPARRRPLGPLATLAGRRFQNREARVLAEEIEQFTAAPAVQVLPAPPS